MSKLPNSVTFTVYYSLTTLNKQKYQFYKKLTPIKCKTLREETIMTWDNTRNELSLKGLVQNNGKPGKSH
jgi:lipoate-protein ligase A